MPPSNPTEHEVLLEAIRSQVARVHTSLPGVVVSYDEATQTASVRPAFKFAYRDATTGEVKRYTPPAIPKVPVAFPGAGDFSITWPLAAGDSVLLVFSERSLDEWRTKSGESHEPSDLRRFDLSDAIAIPGGRSPASPVPVEGYAAGVTVLRAPELRLGSSLATDYVALASLVLTELNALRAEIILHTHATGIGPTGPALGVGPTSNTVAATKVKAE